MASYSQGDGVVLWHTVYGACAQRVIFSSACKVRAALGRSEVNSEHLLLGLVRWVQAQYCCAYSGASGVSPQCRIRNEIERYAIRGGRVSSGEMSLAQRAKRVIDLAYDEARQFNNNYIGTETEHLLSGADSRGEDCISPHATELPVLIWNAPAKAA